MTLYPYLIMTPQQAARFREATATDQHQLDPREIVAGKHAGKYALPRRVMDDPNHAERKDAFLMLIEVALDEAEAWPAPPEE